MKAAGDGWLTGFPEVKVRASSFSEESQPVEFAASRA
jgi:hypothetical protein